jgi:hypothetical protein
VEDAVQRKPGDGLNGAFAAVIGGDFGGADQQFILVRPNGIEGANGGGGGG